jgi:hypothetical protein
MMLLVLIHSVMDKCHIGARAASMIRWHADKLLPFAALHSFVELYA